MNKTLLVVMAATLLLTGCNVSSTGSESAGHSVGSVSVVPEARADYEEGEFQPYSEAAYRQALADNKKVFLDFHADWCPICRGNSPIIDEAFNSDYTKDVVGFKVNYDQETALKKELGITTQSTLVLFEGGKELNRVMGPHTPETLEAFINSRS